MPVLKARQFLRGAASPFAATSSGRLKLVEDGIDSNSREQTDKLVILAVRSLVSTNPFNNFVDMETVIFKINDAITRGFALDRIEQALGLLQERIAIENVSVEENKEVLNVVIDYTHLGTRVRDTVTIEVPR